MLRSFATTEDARIGCVHRYLTWFFRILLFFRAVWLINSFKPIYGRYDTQSDLMAFKYEVFDLLSFLIWLFLNQNAHIRITFFVGWLFLIAYL